MSGVELFDRMRSLQCRIPVIFLTGHGDVPMAVKALKDGAFDFLEKPYDDNALVDKVLAAFAHDERRIARMESASHVLNRRALLTQREVEVMQMILAGNLNKVIADKLGIAMRTVEVHRSHIFEKMQVRSAVELSQLLGNIGDIGDPNGS
jgi:two-component system response regulator DctR